ncbi:cytochrome P450 monooxygenase [Fusarium globosum]|uniref:Cytochrome P450 monooxygenase n=1 Tax=Fusarium globosum TaxID=78864 RepID=A0A8H5XK21_9HYPO|nr:cytochrome P450 monooxygenase [Fusarium globosum]
MLGHRKRGEGENDQDPIFWATQKHSVMSADRENHGRMRRIISHGFSAQSMLGQQPVIQGYVSLLIQRLREHSQNGMQPLEMTSWYNWATFDIIGDLAFGEPFGCLEKADYHPWVSMVFGRVRGNTINTALRRFPFGSMLSKFFMPAKVRRQFEAYYQITVEKVGRRLAMETPRHDFMEALIKSEGKTKLSYPEILDNASLLIVAGSETTATTLSGLTYLLATHPQVLAKLEEEVRSTFASEEEINLLSVQKMTYLFAVINESLRIFPPVPTSFPKRTRPGGDTICGQYVPENTIMGIWQWPLYHSPQNFTLPDTFIPERWLGDARFAGDEQDIAFHPFLTGPRSCIGKNLAYAEMRLIVAKVIWNFDLSIHPSSQNWLDENKAYVLWDKPDLNVYLKPRILDTDGQTSVDAVPTP